LIKKGLTQIVEDEKRPVMGYFMLLPKTNKEFLYFQALEQELPNFKV
jgi:hypothetical protein